MAILRSASALLSALLSALDQLSIRWTTASLDQAHGGLSDPGKMPCRAYGIPASACHAGRGIAAALPDSACAICYALRGRYGMPCVAEAQTRRFRLWQAAEASGLPAIARWTAAMVESIRRQAQSQSRRNELPRFRWFDSGDLQGLQHLVSIVAIAMRLPDVLFWLPSQERGLILALLRSVARPQNLVIRISSTQRGRLRGCRDPRRAGSGSALALLPASTVVDRDQIGTYRRAAASDPASAPLPASTVYCPAGRLGGTCLDHGCSACWQADCLVIAYPGH